MRREASTYYRATAVPAQPRSRLTGRSEADTCVIGGGFAGLSIALDLAERGHDVVLLEAERIGWGASGRNGGFVAAGFTAGNLRLAETVGRAEARFLFDLSRMGQALLADRIAHYGFPGVAKQNGALRCAMQGHDAELDRIRAGMSDLFGVQLVPWTQDQVCTVLATTRYGGALFNPETFTVHPLNLALGLAAAAEHNGARVHEKTAVCGLDLNGGRKRVRTRDGELWARRIILTCGGYIGGLSWPLTAATVPIATFVAVTEPLGAALDTAIATSYAVSDIQFATNYYRRIDGDRLLWGGRIKAWEPRPSAIQRVLGRDVALFYPSLREARFTHTWSGLMSFLRHEMPALGQIHDDVWYATGFGGLGLALTSMAGRLIASAIVEGNEEWRHFARFGLPFAGGPLGRIPAQFLYWKAELDAHFGRVTAHD